MLHSFLRNTVLLACCLLTAQLFGQVSYNANTTVTPYTSNFAYGSNMGYYPPFSDEQIADIMGGNTAQGVPGVGVRSLRPALPEYFLEYWGYDIRVPTFQYYTSQGFKDNTVFIGYPSEAHRDQTQYCPGSPSNLFANLYTPIWDGGANGTPVNDNNYYALYLYKMVTRYKDHVKFWEIWNEPDYDYQGNGWKPADVDPTLNWWNNNPGPCETALQAPVFHYIRMLRISYEVIKTLSPTSYVAVGGIGYPSFLDVLLRNTDNPANGAVTADYPLKGGAYFDALSYHSYPHIDGSLRTWSNAINGFVYKRHSDAAVDGLVNRRNDFDAILTKFGYNGTTYPQKVWIVTENNLPRYQAQDYIGSDEAQRNYICKALVMAQKHNLGQFYVYCPADLAVEGQSTAEYDYMGLYKKPDGSGNPATLVRNSEGTAYKTVSDLLYTTKYDATQTQNMALPTGVRGAAFKTTTGTYVYVLWATTAVDQSETAAAVYSFPSSFGISSLVSRRWDYHQTQQLTSIASNNVALTGSPLILTPVLNTATLTVAPSSQTVGGGSNSFAVSVTSNVSWTITKNATWLSTNITSGTNNGTVTVTCQANTTASARMATLTLSGGGKTATVTVTQTGASLSVSPNTLNISSATQNATINVYASGSWTVTENSSWVTLLNTSGTGNSSFGLSFASNAKTTTRSATITIKSGTLSATVTVNQGGKMNATLSVTPPVINFNSAAAMSRFSVSANTEWRATTTDSWISVSSALQPNPLLSGNGPSTLRFTVNENAGNDRVGTIRIQAEEAVRMIKVIQAGKRGGTERSEPVTTTEDALALQLYPNPVTGQNAYFTLTGQTTTATITLFDGTGRRLATFTAQPDAVGELPTAFLPAGIYMVSAQIGTRSIVQKLVIMEGVGPR